MKMPAFGWHFNIGNIYFSHQSEFKVDEVLMGLFIYFFSSPEQQRHLLESLEHFFMQHATRS